MMRMKEFFAKRIKQSKGVRTCFILCFVCLAALVVGSVGVIAYSAQDMPDLCYGDVDQNGIITADDALSVLKHEVKLTTIQEGLPYQLADMDGDGELTATDALEILKTVVKLIPERTYDGSAVPPETTEDPDRPVVPDETDEPAGPTETDEPTEPAIPDETVSPDETNVPAETASPVETNMPEETKTPAETNAPEETEAPSDGSVVYMTSDITPDGLMAVYQALNWSPTGKVAVKISTGEPPASNYLRPELIGDLVQSVKGTIVECNTAYGGSRTETAMHMQVAKDHGFTEIADVDILDADGSMQLEVDGGNYLQTNYVGSHFDDYDSYIVLSHFKGHAMAGFGGAIKNISIGLGSKEGKCLIHTGGRSHTSPWGGNQTAFTESMAEAGKSVSDYLGNGERIIYINVLNNISIDCDCDGNPAEPDIHDIGILASTDPVAIDQASIDLCFAAEGSDSLKRRVQNQNGLHTLEHAEEISLGSRDYDLVKIDE